MLNNDLLAALAPVETYTVESILLNVSADNLQKTVEIAGAHRSRLIRRAAVPSSSRSTPAPMKEARVYMDEEHDPLRPSARCDDEGRYELRGLPSGEVSLKASAERAGGARTHVRVGAGATVSWDPVERLT